MSWTWLIDQTDSWTDLVARYYPASGSRQREWYQRYCRSTSHVTDSRYTILWEYSVDRGMYRFVHIVPQVAVDFGQGTLPAGHIVIFFIRLVERLNYHES